MSVMARDSVTVSRLRQHRQQVVVDARGSAAIVIGERVARRQRRGQEPGVGRWRRGAPARPPAAWPGRASRARVDQVVPAQAPRDVGRQRQQQASAAARSWAGRSGTRARCRRSRAGITSVHSSTSRPHCRSRRVERRGVVGGVEQPVLVDDERVAARRVGNSRASQGSVRPVRQLHRVSAERRPCRAPRRAGSPSPSARSFSRTRATPCSQSSTGKSRPSAAAGGRATPVRRRPGPRRPATRRRCAGDAELRHDREVLAEQQLRRLA